MVRGTSLPPHYQIDSNLGELVVLRLVSVFFLLSFLWAPGNVIASSASSRKAASVAEKSDAEIEQAIQTKLAKSKIGKDGLRFHVSHGVVTWEGTTSVMQHKGSATRMARTAGAVKVVNNIKVTSSKPGVGLKTAAVEQ
jgi:hypothetical protein